MTLKLAVSKAETLPWPDQSADLVIGSPPYASKLKRYGLKADGKDTVSRWVENLMVPCTLEALRVSKGPVLWICNGHVTGGHYQPAAEHLMVVLADMARRHGMFDGGQMFRVEHPLIWSKNATPNRKDWWCNQFEYVVAVVRSGYKGMFLWDRVATPQKFAKGGVFRQRNATGQRKVGEDYERAAMARPYDIIRATVGGGHMGHDLAHENEAPFPESLIEQIAPALVPDGGVICDPFCGSGTIAAVARRHGWTACLSDTRRSQIDLTMRRLGYSPEDRERFDAGSNWGKPWVEYPWPAVEHQYAKTPVATPQTPEGPETGG